MGLRHGPAASRDNLVHVASLSLSDSLDVLCVVCHGEDSSAILTFISTQFTPQARLSIIVVHAIFDTVTALLNHFPLFALLLRVKDPLRLPGQPYNRNYGSMLTIITVSSRRRVHSTLEDRNTPSLGKSYIETTRCSHRNADCYPRASPRHFHRSSDTTVRSVFLSCLLYSPADPRAALSH